MKIGCSVEGSTDRALLTGLRDRWCPQAELLEGHFRGTSRVSRRREFNNICKELSSKGVALVVFLGDANLEPWRDVLKADRERCLQEYKHLAVFGVCHRNVECWLCADRDWIAARTNRGPAGFVVDDPKAVLESALGITSRDRKELEIAALVQNAPLRHWLKNKSFETFYQDLRNKSGELGCQIENLLESPS